MIATDLRSTSSRFCAWLLEAALPLWWENGADHVHGGFHEALDHEGKPIRADRRARVQARQIYVYATATDLGWRGPAREAVECGLHFFLERYRRDDGLFRTKVSATGQVVDDRVFLYDQAFALFALAAAAKALPDQRSVLLGTARELFVALDPLRVADGGFIEPHALHKRQSNPHMHLLEAALALAELDDFAGWMLLADEITTLAQERFIDRLGAIHEFFRDEWAPALGVDGRIIEPGHQFEWAWLLERWARLKGSAETHQAALRMFESGVRWGIRPSGVIAAIDVATQQLLDDGALHDGTARLWPQTERLKAALIFDDPVEVEKAARGLDLYLDRSPLGSWWDKLRPEGTFIDEPAPASSFYHIVCAISELRKAAHSAEQLKS